LDLVHLQCRRGCAGGDCRIQEDRGLTIWQIRHISDRPSLGRQLLINGQYVGAPPIDNNAVGSIGSWEYAQRFAVTLTPSTNVFTVPCDKLPWAAGRDV
jgi:hypothetical protein